VRKTRGSEGWRILAGGKTPVQPGEFAVSEQTESQKYDHDEVQCEVIADLDCDNLPPGTPRTCCVCIGHDCQEARAERVKHPKRIKLPFAFRFYVE
jgi:hypothetical protein